MSRSGGFVRPDGLEQVVTRVTTLPIYRKWLDQIAMQETFARHSVWHRRFAFDHGQEHMVRVAKTAWQLLDNCCVCREWILAGILAGLVHDIGFALGKTDHAVRSALWAGSILQSFQTLGRTELNLIQQAIVCHGDGGTSPSLIGAILAIADKADLCRARCLYPNDNPVGLIDDYRVSWEDGVLKLEYFLSHPDGRKSFFLFPKALSVPEKMAELFGWQVEYWLNGQRETFEDRGQKYVYRRVVGE